MKRLLLLLILLALPALAHPGHGDHEHHHEPITQAQAHTKAKTVVKNKVAQGKLPEKWLEISAAKSYQKSFGRGNEWVVEFHDKEAEEEKKKVLYVFLSLTGKVLGINFTGN